jgi:hypothetical protein
MSKIDWSTMLVNWGGSGCRRLTVARYRPERAGSEDRADRSGPLVLGKGWISMESTSKITTITQIKVTLRTYAYL